MDLPFNVLIQAAKSVRFLFYHKQAAEGAP